MRLLARALGSSPSRLDDAVRWLDAAVELARTEAPSPDRDARLALTRAHALYVAGRNGDAERIARAALEWIPAGSALEAAARATLGNALMAERRNLEAIAEHRRAVALTEQLRGPRHPEVATRLAGLGVALDEAGQYDEGAAEAARVLELRESVFGPGSAAVATALAQVGENQRFRNDTAGELASYERALAITMALDPPDDALRIRLVGNMVPPLAFAGRLDEARTLLGDTLPVAERVFGRDSLRLAELLQMLATTEEMLDNHEQAVAHGVEAVRLFERHLGADKPRTGEAQLALASTMIETGRYDEAIAVLERAARTFDAVPESHRRGLAFVAALRADALSRSGREREALESGARAVALFDQVYPEGHVEQAEVIVKHAERVARAGQARDARALLVRARAMVQDPAIDPAVREEIDRLIRGLPEG
ncbi:MAG: tetratricopeptide repeat protein [Myxococcales bacterium]|nr:tetratricopeptide repeat protein [Myxococcales bacterium]